MGTPEPDSRLARALTAYDGTAAAHVELLAALVDGSVLAAITATSTAEHRDAGTGLRAESSAEMAVVLLAGPDGSRALPVFSSTTAMQRWRLGVRPVAMTGPEAAQAALEQGAAALVLDSGPVVTELPDLARGWVPVAGTGLAARAGETRLREPEDVPPELVTALRAALAPERLRDARVLQGPDGLVLGVAPRQPLGPAELAALAHRVVALLGGALPADGLDLTVVPARGPGVPVLRPSRWRR